MIIVGIILAVAPWLLGKSNEKPRPTKESGERVHHYAVQRAQGSTNGYASGVLSLEQFALQATTPVRWGQNGQWSFWIYQDTFYKESESLTADQVLTLASALQLKSARKLAKAQAFVDAVASTSEDSRMEPSRAPISDDVKVKVWRRDQGQCVKCGSQKSLEFDHIIPLVMGGSNSVRNLQLLCETCNREKGGNLT